MKYNSLKNTVLIILIFFCSTWVNAITIGDSNFIMVNEDGQNVPEHFRSILNSIGITDAGCTISYIGKNLAITAGHCVGASNTLVRNQKCQNSFIKWGFREYNAGTSYSDCVSIVSSIFNKEEDFAILAITNPPEYIFNLEMDSYDPNLQITIFSHPKYAPLNWSQYCHFEYYDHQEVKPSYIKHNCDTEGGSSGSAILNATNLKIIAIHDGSSDLTPIINYGTPLTNTLLRNELKLLGF